MLENLKATYKPNTIHYTHGTNQRHDEIPHFIDMMFLDRMAAQAAAGSLGWKARCHEERYGHVVTLLNEIDP